MTDKEKQQRAINAKRRLRAKQIAQLRASNEMLEAAKADIIRRYGEGSDSAEQLIADINIAKEQNLERAQSYLGASQQEVETAEYNKVNPAEEQAYYDRLKRQGKSDEELHVKDLTNGSGKPEPLKARTTTKPKSKLAELSERLRKINNKKEETPKEIMDEIPPEEIIAPNAGDITLKPLEHTFDEEFDGFEEETNESKPEKATAAVKEVQTQIKSVEKQKECKDFDPRDVPSYVQYDIIPLPSKGECYAHHKGSLPVAYLTAADENLITSRNMYENGSMIDIILERKILDKSIRVGDLCKGDRDAIAIWLRATAYGPDYPIVATHDGEEFETTIDLSDIHFLDFNLKGDENGWFDYKTESGDELKFKILSSKDENSLIENNKIALDIMTRSDIVDNMNRTVGLLDNVDGEGKEDIIEALNTIKTWALDVKDKNIEAQNETHLTLITDTMCLQTMSINGNTDREFIKNYIENMRAQEALNYRKYMNANVPGVNLNITVPIPESMGGGSFDTFLSIGETIFINV